MLLLCVLSFTLKATSSIKKNTRKFDARVSPVFVLDALIDFEANYRLNDSISIGLSYGSLILDPDVGKFRGGIPLTQKISSHLRFFTNSNQDKSFYLGVAPGLVITSSSGVGKNELSHYIMPATFGYQWVSENKRVLIASEVSLGVSYQRKKSAIKLYRDWNILSFGIAV